MNSGGSYIPVILSDLLSAHGVKDIVISPGSRNTPLILALANEKKFRLYSVIDERSAAFIALGIGIKTGKAVALVCTSGTALLNYAPAIAEAYYSKVPLIVVSADRPQQWIDQYEGQTIRQNGILEGIVAASYNLASEIEMRDKEWYANRIINEALLKANNLKLPVHINVSFAEPLNIIDTDAGRHKFFPRKIDYYKPSQILSLATIKQLAGAFEKKNIAIAVGSNRPDAKLNKSLKRLSVLPNVLIFHEAQSNIKGVDTSIRVSDPFLSAINFYNMPHPDLVIAIGGTWVSSSFKEYIRQLPDKTEVWTLSENLEQGLADCFMHLTKCFDVDAPSFLNGMASILEHKEIVPTSFKKDWLEAKERYRSVSKDVVPCSVWSDLKAIDTLVACLPENTDLHVSNGMSIRYLQVTSYTRLHRIDCNRGCNGIDGSTSTAVGASLVSKCPTVLLTGDMSMVYDISGLASDLKGSNLTVFVVNNYGGDIFRIIKTTRNLSFREDYMTHPISSSFENIADAFGFYYQKIESVEQLKQCCRMVTDNSLGPKLFEINTVGVNNSDVYLSLYQSLKNQKP